MNENTFAELAAGHALNALSTADREAFDDALVAHPEWASYLRTENDTAVLLSEPVGSVVPPPAIRESLLARIATMPQTPDAAAPQTAEAAPDAFEEDFAAAGPAPVPGAEAVAAARRPKRRWFTLAASVVILLALGFGAVTVGQQLTRPAAVVALQEIESAPDAQSASVELSDGGEATAHWSESLGEVVFVSDGLPVLTDEETFELWFVRDEGAISAGTFSGSGETTTLLAGTYEPGDTIAVTVEPAGGSPSGTPTSDPILAIATA